MCTPPLAACTVRLDSWHLKEMKSLKYSMFNRVLFCCLLNAFSFFPLFLYWGLQYQNLFLKKNFFWSDYIYLFLCYFSWQVFRVWPVCIIEWHHVSWGHLLLKRLCCLQKPKEVVLNQEWCCFPGMFDNVWRHFCLSPLVSRVLILFCWQRPGTLLGIQHNTGKLLCHRLPRWKDLGLGLKLQTSALWLCYNYFRTQW